MNRRTPKSPALRNRPPLFITYHFPGAVTTAALLTMPIRPPYNGKGIQSRPFLYAPEP